MLAKGSYRFVLPPLFFGGLLLVFGIYLVGILLTGIGLYMGWFFRDPRREPVQDPTLLLAAADGTIKEVTEENGSLKIAIRMSPFDVHLNRAPNQGIVKKIEHKPGKHNTVYFAGAEEKNEQNLIVVDHPDYTTQILQITGAFARRIESWISLEQEVSQGEKIGMIRFGSQTNMLITVKTGKSIGFQPNVSVGDKVQAGLTSVATIVRNDL